MSLNLFYFIVAHEVSLHMVAYLSTGSNMMVIDIDFWPECYYEGGLAAL